MTTLLSVPPQSSRRIQGSFSGHETFPFRYAWLKKGFEGLLKQADIFQRETETLTKTTASVRIADALFTQKGVPAGHCPQKH